MFGGEVVVFNTNLSYVILVITIADQKTQKTCTGVAYLDNVVITAAHCLVEKRDDQIDKEKIMIFLQGPLSQFTRHRVIGVFIHPYYEPKHSNDVSVIKTVKLPVITLPKLPLSTKLLLILLMVLMPQATPLVVRKVRLYNECSMSWVRVNRNGTVFATESAPHEEDGQNNLSIRSKDYSGKLIIFAESSKMYLCYNRRWKLIGSKRYRGELCLFTEEIFEGYTRFRPVKDPERLVGFQKNGRPLRAKKSRNKACHNFVKSDSDFSIPVHNTLIAMQNAPKALEEMTYTVERSRPHRHQRHRDAQRRARLRFSPNATI